MPAIAVRFDGDLGRREREVDTSDHAFGDDDFVLGDEAWELSLPQDARDFGLENAFRGPCVWIARVDKRTQFLDTRPPSSVRQLPSQSRYRREFAAQGVIDDEFQIFLRHASCAIEQRT